MFAGAQKYCDQADQRSIPYNISQVLAAVAAATSNSLHSRIGLALRAGGWILDFT